MKKLKFLLLIPPVLIIAVIILFALEGWGRRDIDFAVVLFFAAYSFGLVTSQIWKGLNKPQPNNDNVVSDEEKPRQSNNAVFHLLFSAVLTVTITASFIVYDKIKRKIETEECRVYICNELVNYDQQYPMYKNPKDLLALKEQYPLDTKNITENIISNLQLEYAFIEKMSEQFNSFPNGCSKDVYRLKGSMATLTHYTEIWLENLLDVNSEREEYEKYLEDEEDSIFQTTYAGRSETFTVEEHYSEKLILDEHKQIQESRSKLSCK